MNATKTNTLALFFLAALCCVQSYRNYQLEQDLTQHKKETTILAAATSEFVVAQHEINVNNVNMLGTIAGKVIIIEEYLKSNQGRRTFSQNGRIHVIHEGQLPTLQGGQAVIGIERSCLRRVKSTRPS